MKKTILLFVSVLTLALVSTSCSSDDDAEGASIVGKWEISKEGIAASGQEVLVDYNHDCSTSKDNVEFKANGTAVNTYYFGGDCSVTTDTVNYTKNGATLTFTDEGVTYTVTVKELSATTLKIYDTFEDEDSGMMITEVTVYTRAN